MLNIPSRMEGPEQKTIIGKPEITVSAKGITNGKSVYLNDGAEFGPDTKLGATTLGQYGPPYTKTSGVYEAISTGKPVKGIKGSNYAIYSTIDFSTALPKGIYNSSYDFGDCFFQPQTNINFIFNLGASSGYQVANCTIRLGHIIANGFTSTNGAQLYNFNDNTLIIDELNGFSSVSGLYINPTAVANASVFNNLIDIRYITACGNGIASSGNASTNAYGCEGNIFFVNHITDCTNGINIDSNGVGHNTELNQWFIGVVEHCSNDGIVTTNGLNTFYVSNTNGNTNADIEIISGTSGIIRATGYFSGTIKQNGNPAFIHNYEVGYPQGFSITTPTLPAATGSADAVTNTFPFTVRVFQVGESGTHIIDINGNDVLLPADPAEVTLDPGDKIYYATTVATSWKWYGC